MELWSKIIDKHLPPILIIKIGQIDEKINNDNFFGKGYGKSIAYLLYERSQFTVRKSPESELIGVKLESVLRYMKCCKKIQCND